MNKNLSTLLVSLFLFTPAFGHPVNICDSPPAALVAQATSLDNPYALGPLALGMTEDEVVKVLGEPTDRTEPVLQEASGDYIQEWRYPEAGVMVVLASVGPDETQPLTVLSLFLEEPCTWEAPGGLKIGLLEKEAREKLQALLGENVTSFDNGKEEGAAVLFEDAYVVLSARSVDGVVRHIYLGPGPE